MRIPFLLYFWGYANAVIYSKKTASVKALSIKMPEKAVFVFARGLRQSCFE